MQFNQIRWQLLAQKNFNIDTFNTYHTIKLNGGKERIVRVDIQEKQLFDNCYLFGYIHGTVKLLGNIESHIINQPMYSGSNLIIIPSYIETIENYYLHITARFKGIFTLKHYKSSTQIIVNPITKEPMILGIAS